MAEHYYLVAQLPMLFFGREAGISTASFLAEAGKWLSPADFSLLEGVKLGHHELRGRTSRLARDYAAFESRLAGDLVKWRKARMDSQEYKPSFPVALVREGNPLEVEKKLLLYRWNVVDELCVGHHFDIDFLSAYALQLQIRDRLSTFNKEKGMQCFQSLYGKTV